MPRTRSLDKYREKRNFQKTGEPYGQNNRPRARPIFVVQKHGAESLQAERHKSAKRTEVSCV